MSGFSVLQGKSVMLRALEPDDAARLFEWENDTSIWRVSNTLIPFSRYQIEEYVLGAGHDLFAARQLRLMIELLNGTGDQGPVGSIDLFEFDPLHQRAGIGILVREQARHKGIATDALHTIVKYAFTILALHQLYCHISAGNIFSIRLFEGAGFTRCGVRRQWLRCETGWEDEYMYQLFREDARIDE